MLLRAKADTEVCDCTGGTPMHSAAYWGAADVARVRKDSVSSKLVIYLHLVLVNA